MAVDKRAARLGVLATVSLILIGLLGARLWFLQGVQADEYQAKVTSAKTRTVYIPPERGRIFDAEGRVVADNKQLLTVTVDWAVVRKLRNRLELFERLSGPLQTPVDDLMRRHDPCYKEPRPCTKQQQFDSLLPLPLKEDVSEETVALIMERGEDYPGVDVVEQYKRVYPYAPIAAHVVGFMGAISAGNVDTYRAQGYKLNERVGQFGVELSMERELHGRWGKRVYEVDAAGSIVRELEEFRVEPVAGFDVQLSIDLDIQLYAEQALETQLRNRRNLPEDIAMPDSAPHNPLDRETNFKERVYSKKAPDGSVLEYYPEWVQHKAPAGSVVVMNHDTGQIIAMASYPTFDNRWMEAGISGTKYKELFPSTKPDGSPIDPDQSILVNRAVQGNYNLGSTIKPFVAWSAMHAGIITANTVWNDQGEYTLHTIEPEDCQHNGGVARCIFKNATNKRTLLPSKYGDVRVSDALAVSSDTFFYHIGEEIWDASEGLGGENLLKTNLERFGFGNDTGVQLPFEWGGRVPDDAVKAALVEAGVLLPGEAPRLVVGDEVQVAIGQGLMAATPLQIANAYATLANGGFLLVPSIVKNIYQPLTPDLGPAMADLSKGEVAQSFEQPTVRDALEMPENQYQPIIDGLTRVIRGQGVTYPDCGRNCYHATTGESLFAGFPVAIAGKTGTAQGAGNLPWNDSSVFGAFGIVDDRPSTIDDLPYTVVAYLEKSGYGSKAAAPVVKCIFLALAGERVTDPVMVSDQLDLNSTAPAPPKNLAEPACLGGSAGLKD
ncbi:MAG: penicillin-binding transpeptidase domain-containing protein [Actinomycetota bacterium]|nr:penicillin-binding transpeptidase domain-containing protein [Actinomycetota bacterium]